METTLHEERRSVRVLRAGTLAEGIAGIGAVALTIIGLANKAPQLMLAVATIAVGAAFLFEGGAITARLSNILASTRGRAEVQDFGLGMTTEFVGGIVGVVLGILSLFRLDPLVLIPIASIVFGSVMLISSGVTARLNSYWISLSEERETYREVAREAVMAASGVQLLIGLGAVTLGILALIGINPLILSLVSILSVGFTDLLSGTAIMGRMSRIARR